MNKLIIKRHTQSYLMADTYLSLEDDMLIPKSIMNITTCKIDGRQKRFLDSATILLFESASPEITFEFSAVVNKKQLHYMVENKGLIMPLKSKNKGKKNINAEVGIMSLNVNGESNGVYVVDVSLEASGQVSYN